jgi:drug/metabolite transporter (DMT)-like permease
LAVGMMIRAYQITDAARASVIEYVTLPASAIWSWLLWGELLTPMAVGGMVLIIAAGSLIALRAKAIEAVPSGG